MRTEDCSQKYIPPCKDTIGDSIEKRSPFLSAAVAIAPGLKSNFQNATALYLSRI
ncbi:hypothetical protein [Okeania sp. SIO2B3]|uniref:hypothetical protein n=1 Tax=Okeania sp. SIO2B3 TaxID=2607784 RepID=UPI0013C0B8C7|nr:hypothetical protein [Okeania sp. SIO2B3]NET44195.1 hypothetical protein [Okeania sp. SIO2B3]